jgi:poly(beta-D-mannuronate) lyase
MSRLHRALPLVFAFALCGCQQNVAPAPPPAAAMAPGDLHSPWDSSPVATTNVSYDCGPAVPVGPDITVTGALDSGNKHLSEDVKAAVYSQSTDALLELTARVVKAADTYRATGSRAAAQCAVNLTASAAYAHAMTGYMASPMAWLEQNTALHSIAIAWLKVRNANAASPADTELILAWFEDVTRIERDHWQHFECTNRTCYIKNNKGLGTAMAAAAVGIAANDDGLFHWAVGEYHSAIGEINDRGMLHYDTRGRDAFKNNLRSAADLVQIAEFGEINGIPLYGYDNGAIHLLIHTVALGIVSPGPYRSATKANQAAPSTVEPWEIAWASVYNRRFPDPIITSLLQQVGPGGSDMWGGEPWDPEGDSDPGL